MTDREPRSARVGREITGYQLAYAELLMELRRRAAAYTSFYDQRLEALILEAREQGASVRSLADQLGVSSATVQRWTKNARDRRTQGGSVDPFAKPFSDEWPLP